MDETKPNIRTASLEQIKEFLSQNGQKAFRAAQIYSWLWQKNVASFEEMTDLSKDLRHLLQTHFELPQMKILNRLESKDGTVKFAFQLFDGNQIEGVLIPSGSRDRMTACVSSQVGCSLTCKFCATGYLPLKRNLLPFEIYDQTDIIRKEAEKKFDRPLTNIVYMGMGEPLLNYKNVLESVRLICSPEGMGMSPRRITVSTAGIAKMIKKLGDDEVKFEFALSLHAADDEKRNRIMPINETNTLEALADALKYFYQKTGTRTTLEYIIFDRFNDFPEDARLLSEFARTVPTKINVIEYNPIAEAEFKNASAERTDKFIAFLESRGHIVNVRRSRGKDVDGACGQLALKMNKQN